MTYRAMDYHYPAPTWHYCAPMPQYTVHKMPANHVLHLLLTLFTAGFWAPVWIICAIVGRTEVRRNY